MKWSIWFRSIVKSGIAFGLGWIVATFPLGKIGISIDIDKAEAVTLAVTLMGVEALRGWLKHRKSEGLLRKLL